MELFIAYLHNGAEVELIYRFGHHQAAETDGQPFWWMPDHAGRLNHRRDTQKRLAVECFQL